MVAHVLGWGSRQPSLFQISRLPREKGEFGAAVKFESRVDGHGSGEVHGGRRIGLRGGGGGRWFAMAGSTCFHSSSLVQRDGRIHPSGFWGAEVTTTTGFRGSSYASCGRLKIRKRGVGFTCFNSESDGVQNYNNVRVARARAVESLETTSPGMLACLLHAQTLQP